MMPRIKHVEPLDGYKLRVDFDGGRRVIYDVDEDIRNIRAYADLREIPGLFKNVQLDKSRTIVFWNDQIDLPSDSIYEFGTPASS